MKHYLFKIYLPCPSSQETLEYTDWRGSKQSVSSLRIKWWEVSLQWNLSELFGPSSETPRPNLRARNHCENYLRGSGAYQIANNREEGYSQKLKQCINSPCCWKRSNCFMGCSKASRDNGEMSDWMSRGQSCSPIRPLTKQCQVNLFNHLCSGCLIFGTKDEWWWMRRSLRASKLNILH